MSLPLKLGLTRKCCSVLTKGAWRAEALDSEVFKIIDLFRFAAVMDTRITTKKDFQAVLAHLQKAINLYRKNEQDERELQSPGECEERASAKIRKDMLYELSFAFTEDLLQTHPITAVIYRVKLVVDPNLVEAMEEEGGGLASIFDTFSKGVIEEKDIYQEVAAILNNEEANGCFKKTTSFLLAQIQNVQTGNEVELPEHASSTPRAYGGLFDSRVQLCPKNDESIVVDEPIATLGLASLRFLREFV